MTTRPVCAVVGVGPGNGAAFARKFAAEGYKVALLARNEDFLAVLEEQIDSARAYQCDVTDLHGMQDVFDRIKVDLGPVEVLIYNAGAGEFTNFDKTTATGFERAWRVNALGCLVASQQVVPDMRSRGHGNIVIIGATASFRGGANFLPFASAKAAQRSLAQSMARLLGADKIHVSYVIIDGVIDLVRTRKSMPDKPDEFFMSPDHIAESVYFLTRQPPSAWTFEIDLRPFKEKW
ncbi:MAG: SDR family NAD(P)-dependent oxidoreductase [Gammaproteobacteria bacterium]|nr:SDR family NAD(P)-dependent oxidoreductase [Gammaproteobacteria bacterium]MCI0590543.1 SDR family NAD(P)-dependent oxidoreductase [Gammaproteobacteria bacterium]